MVKMGSIGMVISLLMVNAFVLAADNEQGRDGWVRLFDGKSLAGWRANENRDSFSVNDGMIKANGRRSHLFYEGKVRNNDFQNFEFRTDVMTMPGANSGVYFHTKYQESGWLADGYEVQINNSHKGTGDYIELNKTGSLYAVRNLFKSFVGDNEWFKLYFKVQGRTVTIKINDKLVVEYVEPDEPFRNSEGRNRVLSRGTFALQGHDPDSTVYFKNIYVRPLADAPKPKDTRSREEIELQNRITKYHADYLPLTDFHVHLKGGLTLEEAMAKSRETGIFYGVAVNCGLGFPVQSDEGAREFFKSLEGQPVFRAMQAEGREWVNMFSKDVIAGFDYVFTDSMTFHDRKGRRTRLWMKDEVWVDDPQDFMEMLVEKIEGILNDEPIDIYVNPTFLPAVIQADYDRLWTPERMDRVIRALVKNDVAMEINSRYRIPSIAFIKRAKAAGVKFTFGTNNGDRELGHLEYCLDVIDECGLKKADIFMPKPKGQKKIELKSGSTAGRTVSIRSPDGKTAVAVRLSRSAGASDDTHLEYKVDYAGVEVVGYSPLGIVRDDQKFAGNLVFVEEVSNPVVDETYTVLHGKRRVCRNHYAESTVKLLNDSGAGLELIVRAYNDGVAFRYRFGANSDWIHTVTKELTGFQLPVGGKLWLHPFDKAGRYTPAYETYYMDDVPVGTPSPNAEGWAFPVLFRNEDGSRWGLVTEAAVDPTYCGSRLEQNAPGGLYRIRFPHEGEGNGTGEVNPSSSLPWSTPWRVVILGDGLADIVESTLVENLNPPSVVDDTSWIKPGRASWSWLYDHDSPQDHDKLRKWIDLAAEMGWEYSLIDANWTIMKNGTIHDLIAYANEKGVGLLLWYNSGGEHNVVTEKPRGTMSLRDVRRFEFDMLRRWGIKGVKVDFFQSDKQNIIKLYHDILEDAADYHIMVNFHGCTLPRGWSRTYPHLMCMEAVKGEECYSFDREFPKRALTFNTIIPYTRNVVGPMDYTPVMLKDNVYPRLTTQCHELAQSVVFESAWLHFADGVEPYLSLPQAPRQFLKEVPVAWDDTKFLAGYPGKYIVMARRRGNQWFIGGLSGEEAPRQLNLDLSFLGAGSYDATIINDGFEPRTFVTQKQLLTARDKLEITMAKYGGFAAQLKP